MKKKHDFFLAYVNPGYSRVPSKNVNPFGPAVWPATVNIKIYIYMSEKLYYIDKTTTTVNFINFECRSDGDILVIVFYFSVNNKPDLLILKNRFGTDTL